MEAARAHGESTINGDDPVVRHFTPAFSVKGIYAAGLEGTGVTAGCAAASHQLKLRALKRMARAMAQPTKRREQRLGPVRKVANRWLKARQGRGLMSSA